MKLHGWLFCGLQLALAMAFLFPVHGLAQLQLGVLAEDDQIELGWAPSALPGVEEAEPGNLIMRRYEILKSTNLIDWLTFDQIPLGSESITGAPITRQYAADEAHAFYQLGLYSAELSLSPRSVGFGEVPRDNVASDAVVISNPLTQQMPLWVSSIGLSGSENWAFGVAGSLPFPVGLAPGEQLEVSVVFTNSAPPQVYAAFIELQTSISPEPIRVPVTAVGVEPEIAVDPDAVQFGLVRAGSGLRTIEISISNRLTAGMALVIDEVLLAGDGAFSLPAPAPSQILLSPGESTNPIEISFDPALPGEFSGIVTITSTDPDTPVLAIPVTGVSVDSQLEVDPPQIEFGSVPFGTNRVLQLSIGNLSSATAAVLIETIELVDDSGGVFALPAPLSTNTPLNPGQTVALSVQFAPDTIIAHTGLLRLHTDDPTAETVDVALSGYGMPAEIVITPASPFHFAACRTGEIKVQTFSIQNNAPFFPLNIISVDLSPTNPFSITRDLATGSTIFNGDSVEFDVEFQSATPGSFVGDLQVQVDGAGVDTLHVAIYAEAGNPSLVVLPSELDFGEVKQIGTPVTATLNLLNDAGAASPLTIEDLFLTNGAAVFQVISAPALPATLAPGEQVDVEMSYTASDLDGQPNLASLIILTDDPTTSPVAVPLSGRGVRSNLKVSRQAVEFGTVTDGEVRVETVTLSNSLPEATGFVALESIEISPTTAQEVFDATSPFVPILRPGEETVVEISYLPLPGLRTAELVIVSDDSGAPEIRIPLSGTAQIPEIGELTPYVQFDYIAAGSQDQKTLRVGNSTGAAADLAITIPQLGPEAAFRISGLAMGEELSFSLAPGEFQDVDVMFTPGGEGQFIGRVNIFTSDPHRPEVSTFLFGSAGVPSMAPPNSVDFGYVPLGTLLEKKLIIANNLSATFDLEITELRFGVADPAFELVDEVVPGQPVKISPRDLGEFRVRFLPSDPGKKAYLASIILRTSDPDFAMLEIPVSGSLLEPTGLEVTPASVTLLSNQTFQLTATLSYSDGSTNDVTIGNHWTTSDPVAATVDQWGAVAAGAPGTTATITATVQGFQDDSVVHVASAAPPDLGIIVADLEMLVGQTHELPAIIILDGRDITSEVWDQLKVTSADETVVEVYGALLRAVDEGQTTITVEFAGISESLQVETFLHVPFTPFILEDNYSLSVSEKDALLMEFGSPVTVPADLESTGTFNVPIEGTYLVLGEMGISGHLDPEAETHFSSYALSALKVSESPGNLVNLRVGTDDDWYPTFLNPSSGVGGVGKLLFKAVDLKAGQNDIKLRAHATYRFFNIYHSESAGASFHFQNLVPAQSFISIGGPSSIYAGETGQMTYLAYPFGGLVDWAATGDAEILPDGSVVTTESCTNGEVAVSATYTLPWGEVLTSQVHTVSILANPDCFGLADELDPSEEPIPDVEQEEPSGDDDADSTCKTSDSVILSSGEERFDRVDLLIPGRAGLDFVFDRRYRSRLSYDGPLGYGWDFNYNERLYIRGNGDVTRANGYGHIDTWKRNTDGSYKSPTGFFSTLIKRGDGTYVLREPNGFKRVYWTDGRLMRHEDRFGNAIRFRYDAAGNLNQAIDVYGRVIEFYFEPRAGRDRLVRLRDFWNREILFSYDGQGNLIEVRTPVVTGTSTGNDFPNGRTERYAYSIGHADPRLNHNLLSVTYPQEVADGGMPAMTWVYGEIPNTLEFDRVLSETKGGANATGVMAGGTAAYQYELLGPAKRAALGLPEDPDTNRLAVMRVVITERNGNVLHYFGNAKGQHILSRRLTKTGLGQPPLRPAEPAYYETQFFFDEDGQSVRVISPEGNEVRYTYDQTGPRAAQRNLTEIRRIAGPRGADGNGTGIEDIITTIQYEPLYNQVLTTTDPRGNATTFVPPLGATSAERYTSRVFYDYQEGTDPVAEAVDFGIDLSSVSRGLGDLNGDGRTDQDSGLQVRVQAPDVLLQDLPQNLAPVEPLSRSSATQQIITENQWNDRGQLIAVIDAEGNLTSFDFYPENDPDGDGLLSVSPIGISAEASGYLKSTCMDCASTTRRTSATEPAALTNTFGYDPVGNIVSVRNARGVVTGIEVNQLNEAVTHIRGVDVSEADFTRQLITSEAPLRYKLRLYYDHNGRVVMTETENDDGTSPELGDYVETTTAYDILDNPIQSTVEVDATVTLVTRCEYEANELQTRVIAPEGNVVATAYDERNLPFRITRGFGSPEASTTQTDYDLNGNVIRTIDAADNDGNGLPEPTTFKYDGFDRLVHVIDALGDITQTFYDPAGNPVHTRVLGHPPAFPGLGQVPLTATIFWHDEHNRVFRTDRPLFMAPGFHTIRPVDLQDGNNDGVVTFLTEYDALSRPVAVIEDDLQVTQTRYDGASRIVETIDHIGNRRQIEYDKGSNPIRTTSVEVSDPIGAFATETYVTHRVYDQLDRLVRVTDNAGQTTRFVYDSRDNLISSSDPVAPEVEDPYGIHGLINLPGNTKSMVYDGLNRVVQEIYDLRVDGRGTNELDLTNPSNPDGQVTITYDYDGNSRLTRITDDSGNETSFTYDALDRKTHQINADSSTYLTFYDADDNVIASIDANGTQVTRAHDVLNRLVRCDVQRAPGVEGTAVETYAYDGLSRLVSFTDDNGGAPRIGSVVERAYDSLGRLVEERQNGQPVSSVFAGDGKVLSLAYPGGRKLECEHDRLDRPTAIRDAALNTTILEMDWIGPGRRPLERRMGNGTAFSHLNTSRTQVEGYDSVQRVIRERHRTGALSFVDREYAYNRASIRTSEKRHDDAGLADYYEYDSLYRVVGADYDRDTAAPSPRDLDSARYQLDGVGNRVQQTIMTESQAIQKSFAVNKVNEYIKINGVAQTFDLNGNLRSDERLRYTYDYRNRLVAVQTHNFAPIAQYSYDAGNRRIQKVVFNTSLPGLTASDTRYFYARWHCVEEQNAFGQTQVTYIHGTEVDQIRQIQRTAFHRLGAGTVYLHQNVRGDVVAATDAAGSVVERIRFDDFGNPDSLSIVGNPFMFQGKRFDTETELYYSRNRNYDPVQGRFIQRDPLWDSASFGNQYTFAGAGPVSFRDSMGTNTEEDGGGGWLDEILDFDPYEAFWESKGILHHAFGGEMHEVALELGDVTSSSEIVSMDAVWDAQRKQVLSAQAISAAIGEVAMMNPGVQLGVAIDGRDPQTGLTLTVKERLQYAAGGILGAAGGRIGLAKTRSGTTVRAARIKAIQNRLRVGGNRAAAKVGRGGCFLAGTLVLTEDGSRPIEEIEVGDRVLSRDDQTGEVAFKSVSRLFHGRTDRVVHLSYVVLKNAQRGRSEGSSARSSSVEGHGGDYEESPDEDPRLSQTLRCTTEHPFWVIGQGWVAARDICAGDNLFDADGEQLLVTGHEIRQEEASHYNFKVEDWHTYFVSETEQDLAVWVHNRCFPEGFKSKGQFNQFGEATHGSLTRAGFRDTQAYMQGSAVTGKSWRTGDAFDVGRRSDFDIALTGESLSARARELGIKFKGAGHTRPLSSSQIERLGLGPMRDKLSRLADGREINFMIFRDAAGAQAKGPSMWIPKK